MILTCYLLTTTHVAPYSQRMGERLDKKPTSLPDVSSASSSSSASSAPAEVEADANKDIVSRASRNRRRRYIGSANTNNVQRMRV